MFSPSTAWYRHGIGKAFVILLGIIGFALLAFGVLVGYYLIQYKAGRLTVIEQKIYEGRQSAVRANTGTAVQTIKNPNGLIRPFNPTLGDKNAPLTVIMFIDFECPFCQADYETMKTLRASYGEAAYFVFKNYPVEQLHEHARLAAIAAMCAHEQNAFWPYYDSLFTTRNVTEEGLVASAKALNIYNEQFITCRNTSKPSTTIETDMNDANTIAIKGTPTYVVNGIRVDGNIPLSSWKTLIVEALKRPPGGTN